MIKYWKKNLTTYVWNLTKFSIRVLIQKINFTEIHKYLKGIMGNMLQNIEGNFKENLIKCYQNFKEFWLKFIEIISRRVKKIFLNFDEKIGKIKKFQENFQENIGKTVQNFKGNIKENLMDWEKFWKILFKIFWNYQ